jgi:ribonuclease HI
LITAHIDGGARGNPGPAGYGVHIEDDSGTILAELHGGIGIATNNVAEYNGLLAALAWAREHGHTALHIKADSLLLVEQMRGRYKVKHAGLQPLHARATLLAHEIGRVTFEHVPREKNKDADRLSNLGMDESEEQLARGPAATPGQGELF